MALDLQLANSLSSFMKPLMPGIFAPHNRSIGGIHAHVTLEETERDEVTTTHHPVEQGAPIADHAFKQPVEVIIRAGWNLQDGDLSADTGIYGLFLQMQAAFELFDLMTGKRLHRNMLITSVVNVTDNHSEYALMLVLACREIILTKTQSATVGTATNQTNQASPQTTAPTIDRGSQQIQNASTADQQVVLNSSTYLDVLAAGGT
jgi:hypothetical protein